MPRTALCLLATLAAGCGGARTPESAPEPAWTDACVIGTGAGRDTRVVAAATGADTALLDPARAAVPVAIDCEGRPRPRLARAWSRDSSGMAWTLVVPDAPALVRRWREQAGAAAALRAAGAAALVPLDAHRLVVSFDAPQPALPGVFTDLMLAAPVDSAAAPRLRHRGPDLRDALDDAGLVVTADSAVLDLAAGRSGWSAHPLPWNRLYLLLAPRGWEVRVPGADTSAFRAALASEVVGVAARGAAPPYWWEPTSCARAVSASRAGAAGRTVLYVRDDPVARALAERLVALSDAPGAVARGADPAALANAMARGDGLGYVVSTPRQPAVPCRELAGWPDAAAVLPLVETRPTALVHESAGRFTVDHDGGLLPAPSP